MSSLGASVNWMDNAAAPDWQTNPLGELHSQDEVMSSRDEGDAKQLLP